MVSILRFIAGAMLVAKIAAATFCTTVRAEVVVPPPSFTVTDLGEVDPVAINGKGDMLLRSPAGSWINYEANLKHGFWSGTGSFPQDARGRPFRVLLRRGDTVTTLDDLFDAFGLNDSAVVVGASLRGRPAEWENGVVKGFPGPDLGFGAATAINGRGNIVGSCGIRAFEYDGARAKFLTLPSDGVFSMTAGINDSGDVVGTESPAGGAGDAVMWRKDAMTVIHVGDTAIAINGAGDIVLGASQPELLRSAVGGELHPLTPIPATNYDGCYASAINDSCWIVGRSMMTEAFNGPAMIGPDGVTTYPPPDHATLWIGLTPYDINSLTKPAYGRVLSNAIGINNADEILCDGTIRNKHHAFLLTVETGVKGISQNAP